jgi:polyhydroxyalkanoate synthesis regulator phasin
MGKKIYITEAQLQEIIGNGAYLDDKDTTNEYKLGGKEVSVDGVVGDYVDGNVAFGKPVTTDKFAQTQTNQRRRRGMINCSTQLSEANQDMKGKEKTFQLSHTEADKLRQRITNYGGSKNDAGYKRAQTLVNRGRISYDNAYRVLDDMKNGNAGAILDPDGTLQHELESKIKTKTDMSQSQRDAKMAAGQNVIKSAPKTGAKGGAHTPNGDNVIGITY